MQDAFAGYLRLARKKKAECNTGSALEYSCAVMMCKAIRVEGRSHSASVTSLSNGGANGGSPTGLPGAPEKQASAK